MTATWLGVSKLVAPLLKLAKRVPEGAPVREAGAKIVAHHYGDRLVDHPPIVNVGVLAVQSRGAPATYHVRPSASQVVHETDLHSIPSAPPMLLLRPGIIEARRPETGERLWGEVASLGWYVIKGADMHPERLTDSIMLIGCLYPDGIYCARWTPAWTGRDIDDQLPYPDHSLAAYVEQAQHHAFAREAARYLTVFGLLELVADGPLRFEILDRKTQVREVRTKPAPSLHGRPAPQLPPKSRGESERPIDPRALVLAGTIVGGYLKRQRHGEGNSRVRWQYVQGHRSHRWCRPEWLVERDYSHTGLANGELVYRGRRG